MKQPLRFSFARACCWALFAAAFAPALVAVTSLKLTDDMTKEMGRETQATVFFLEQMHYLQKPLAQFDQRKLLSAYMSDLDSRHLFLLDSDVTGFQDQFAPTLAHNIRELGNIEPAYAIFEKFRERVRERVDWINKRLDGDIDLTAKDSYRPDRDDSPWPANKDDADKLWEQQIRFELINELLAADTREIDAANKKAKADAAPKADDAKTAAAHPDAETAAPSVTPHTDAPITVNNLPPQPAATPPKPDTKPKTDAEKLAAAKDTVRKRYDKSLRSLDETEAVEVQEVFLDTLAGQYDPHSSFFSDYGQDSFNIEMSNSLIGIGAVLEDKDDYCTISELIVGGPAEKSGLLHVGDQIVAVGQADGDLVDVVGVKLRKTVGYIRGAEGSLVRLLVIPATDSAEKKTITLKREKVELTTALAKAQIIDLPLDNKTVPIGVIDLPAFYGGGSDNQSTTENVRELIGKLKDAGVQGIVLDVRRNGGGFLDEAVNLTGLFIPPAAVLQTRSFNGDTKTLKSQDNKVVWNGPLIVLVSKGSASATEIMTGALQDYHRALVVGDHTTHGKGTVQNVIHFNTPSFTFSETGSAKITIEKWYLPDGKSVQSKGVSADITLPSDIDFLPIGESDLKNALPWDSIKALPLTLQGDGAWRASLVDDKLLSTLSQDSQARESSLAELKLLQERVAWEKAREQQKDFSLNFAERLQERKDDIVFRDQLRARTEDLAKSNYKSTEVLLDVAKEQQKDKPAKTPTIDPLANPDEIDDADTPIDFDIQLREGLRIMGDWIHELNQTANLPAPSSTVAAAPAKTPVADAKPAN